MANSQRRKGLRGEAEVAAIWRANGFYVQNLEGQGDMLVSGLFGNEQLHVEVKRQNRLRTEWIAQAEREAKRQNRLRTEWIAQAEREAPAGAVPVVAWRPDGGKWWAMIPLEDLARLLA